MQHLKKATPIVYSKRIFEIALSTARNPANSASTAQDKADKTAKEKAIAKAKMAAPSPSFKSSISPALPTTTTTTTTTGTTSTTTSPSLYTTSITAPSEQPPSQSQSQQQQFQFPREWHFPPFFTRQPNQNTRRSQQMKWASLILSYCRHRRIYKLALSSPAAEALFHNRRIDRRLGLADVREVLEFMRRDGRAEFINAGNSNTNNNKKSSNSGGGGGGGGLGLGGDSDGAGAGSNEDYGDLSGSGDVVWIFWKTPEEWAALIEAWVDQTAQKGTVLTLYELSEGEDTIRTEFHGLDLDLLQKALQVLVKRGKAQIFGQDDQLGVKFF